MVITEIVYGLHENCTWDRAETIKLLRKLNGNGWTSSIVGFTEYTSDPLDWIQGSSEDNAIDRYPDSFDELYNFINTDILHSFEVMYGLQETSVINKCWKKYCSESGLDQNDIHSITFCEGRFKFLDAYFDEPESIQVDPAGFVLSIDGNYPTDIFMDSRLISILDSLNSLNIGMFKLLGAVQG